MGVDEISSCSNPRRHSALAMCVYNGAPYLQEQLDSIAQQTVRLDQIVIVDDKSNDGSWDLLQAWKANCGLNVSLVRNDHNLGFVRNFEKASALVDADIVFFADQDDIWQTDKVERMLHQFDDPKVMLAHSDADLIDEESARLGRQLFATLLLRNDERAMVRSGRAAAVYLKRNLVTGAACAVRRDLLKHALPFPQSHGWSHDEWLALVAGVTGSVAMLEESTMSYRLHGSNTIGIPITDWRWRLQTIVHGIFSPQRQALERRLERLNILRERCIQWDPPVWFLQELDAVLEHLAHRLSLSANPLRRIQPVLREWRGRRYNVWSNGELSVIHDILLAN